MSSNPSAGIISEGGEWKGIFCVQNRRDFLYKNWDGFVEVVSSNASAGIIQHYPLDDARTGVRTHYLEKSIQIFTKEIPLIFHNENSF